jgi:hypothetical protein
VFRPGIVPIQPTDSRGLNRAVSGVTFPGHNFTVEGFPIELLIILTLELGQ